MNVTTIEKNRYVDQRGDYKITETGTKQSIEKTGSLSSIKGQARIYVNSFHAKILRARIPDRKTKKATSQT